MKKSDVRALRDVLSGKRPWVIIQGKLENVLPLLGDHSIDSTITDPPYAGNVHTLQRRIVGRDKVRNWRQPKRAVKEIKLGFNSLTDELRELAAGHIGRVTRRFALAFSDAESCHLWKEALQRASMDHIREGDWVKLNAQPNLTGRVPAVGAESIQISRSYQEYLKLNAVGFDKIEIARGPVKKSWNGGGHPAIWFYPIVDGRKGKRIHTTEKPLGLMKELVQDFTNPGEVVLDCFAGSGTTGAACIQLGRRFIGIEKNAAYARAAKKRLKAEVEGVVIKNERPRQIDLLDVLAEVAGTSAKQDGKHPTKRKEKVQAMATKAKKPAGKNPYGVKVGELWRPTDKRADRSSTFEIYKITKAKRAPYATSGAWVAIVGPEGRQKEIKGREIKLDRFKPGSTGYERVTKSEGKAYVRARAIEVEAETNDVAGVVKAATEAAGLGTEASTEGAPTGEEAAPSPTTEPTPPPAEAAAAERTTETTTPA